MISETDELDGREVVCGGHAGRDSRLVRARVIGLRRTALPRVCCHGHRRRRGGAQQRRLRPGGARRKQRRKTLLVSLTTTTTANAESAKIMLTRQNILSHCSLNLSKYVDVCCWNPKQI